MMIILDNGHGKETPGKRSPIWRDGSQLFEYEFNRDIVKRISVMLDADNIKYHVLVPELEDITLQERCIRANNICDNVGECVLFSIHANAGGGTGWECYTTPGQTKADEIATMLYSFAEEEFKGWKIRKDMTDGDSDKESNFYILRNTKMPAVLSENFFMDTESDCHFIMSEVGRRKIANIHYLTIKNILK